MRTIIYMNITKKILSKSVMTFNISLHTHFIHNNAKKNFNNIQNHPNDFIIAHKFLESATIFKKITDRAHLIFSASIRKRRKSRHMRPRMGSFTKFRFYNTQSRNGKSEPAHIFFFQRSFTVSMARRATDT